MLNPSKEQEEEWAYQRRLHFARYCWLNQRKTLNVRGRYLLGRRYLREMRGFHFTSMHGIAWMNVNNGSRRKSVKTIVNRGISLRLSSKIIWVFRVCYHYSIVVPTY